MKKKYIVANWKMNLSPSEAIYQVKKIIQKFKNKVQRKAIELVICPTFTEIPTIAKMVQSKGIVLGAQDVSAQESGSFTGDVSVKSLQTYNCKYVIIGHSEKRKYQSETNEVINQKIKTVLANNLTPILCIGESLVDRETGNKDSVLLAQLSLALKGVELLASQKILIAYEPIWAIGSGRAVEPMEVVDVQATIKRFLLDSWSNDLVDNNISILYGGSVDQSNIKGFLEQPTIDGVLVGGASLKIEEFEKIINYNI